MAAALAYRHTGCACGLSFQVIAGGYDHRRVLRFLRRVLHRYRWGALWLVWEMADPAGKAYYENNTAIYLAKLDALDAKLRAELSSCKKKDILLKLIYPYSEHHALRDIRQFQILHNQDKEFHQWVYLCQTLLVQYNQYRATSHRDRK